MDVSQLLQNFYMLCIICILSRWRATVSSAHVLSLTCTITKTSEGMLHIPYKS